MNRRDKRLIEAAVAGFLIAIIIIVFAPLIVHAMADGESLGVIIIPGIPDDDDRHEREPSLKRCERLCEAKPDEGVYFYAEAWKPDEEDVTALSRMAYGEARGCSDRGIEACMWCVMHRLDAGYASTVTGVVSAPGQFYGYCSTNPVTDHIRGIAVKVLLRHHAGNEPLLPDGYLWFTGNGRENVFRNQNGERWTA